MKLLVILITINMAVVGCAKCVTCRCYKNNVKVYDEEHCSVGSEADGKSDERNLMATGKYDSCSCN
jgi:hypothetical protein